MTAPRTISTEMMRSEGASFGTAMSRGPASTATALMRSTLSASIAPGKRDSGSGLWAAVNGRSQERLEPGTPAAAHGDPCPVAQDHDCPAPWRRPHLAYAIDSHQGAAVHADEVRGVEPPPERGERLANQMSGRARVHARVVVVGFDPVDLARVEHERPRRRPNHEHRAPPLPNALAHPRHGGREAGG